MALPEELPAAASRTADPTQAHTPFGAPHVFVLAVIDGGDTSAVHRIMRSETVIGRDEGVHFLVDDERVSKTHCKLRVEGSVCTIVDLDSRNGTKVNGRRLAAGVAQRLRNLDEIEIGNHRLFLLVGRFRPRPRNVLS